MIPYVSQKVVYIDEENKFLIYRFISSIYIFFTSRLGSREYLNIYSYCLMIGHVLRNVSLMMSPLWEHYWVSLHKLRCYHLIPRWAMCSMLPLIWLSLTRVLCTMQDECISFNCLSANSTVHLKYSKKRTHSAKEILVYFQHNKIF
jgi:hypothetical protein